MSGQVEPVRYEWSGRTSQVRVVRKNQSGTNGQVEQAQLTMDIYCDCSHNYNIYCIYKPLNILYSSSRDHCVDYSGFGRYRELSKYFLGR